MTKRVLDEFYKLPIQNVMRKTGFAILPRDSSVMDVLDVLVDFDHIWVTEFPRSGKIVGIISRKDFLETILPPQYAEDSIPGRASARTLYYEDAVLSAEDIMTRSLIKVDEKATVLEALRTMKANFIRHLPVVRDGELMGEIAIRDFILRYIELYKYRKKQDDVCEE
jgi:CBS domain-containing protein